MGLLDLLRTRLLVGGRYESVTFDGPTVSEVLGLGPEDLFRTQPHLRTVITFLARNIAQLGLHTFERVSDNDRRRLTTHPVARALRKPNSGMTGYELLYTLVSDLKLYDVALWTVSPDRVTNEPRIHPIPPMWIHSHGGGTHWDPEWVNVLNPGSPTPQKLRRGEFILFHGYRPGDPSSWSSPIDSLQQILAEQVQAWSYRQQIWQRGGRVGAYLTRPPGVQWSAEAREKFARDWQAKWTGRNGPRAGGTPILEDGMELKRLAFSAREEEWAEVAKLSLATVAAVYHVNPTMVGVLDNANYSNVREFRRMLYADTLGPDLTMIEDRLNTFLVPMLDADAAPGSVYVEFNVSEKLQGSFEEQAAVVSTSVGRPWMTANEARGRFNMPALDEGDDLVIPLNVLVGGQASPRDSGSQNLASGPTLQAKAPADPVAVKSGARVEDERSAAGVLRRAFRRQRAAVLSALGAKAAQHSWWDEDRWNGELADDLYALAVSVSAGVAKDTLESLGVEPDLYDAARTEKFLRAVAESRAGAINSTTRDEIAKALAAAEDGGEIEAVGAVFDVAQTSRAERAGLTLATTLAGFAVSEVGKQISRPGVTKTWVVQSKNPRASHAAMDGETVGIDEAFSNGANWPGDPVLGAEGVSGCMCGVEVTIP